MLKKGIIPPLASKTLARTTSCPKLGRQTSPRLIWKGILFEGLKTMSFEVRQ
jgi:hypothetical protein